MATLVVALLDSDREKPSFAVSHHSDKEAALRSWEEDGLDVRNAREVKLHISGETSGAVLRALAGTADGAETLSRLLAGAFAVHEEFKGGSS